MATGQISRRRRLVAADLAGENAEVLRESEGEEASAAAEEEVFGLESKRFPSITSKPNTSSSAAAEASSSHSPEALLNFLRQDLLQQDDGAERSDAMRRRHREICPVAMDPPSMVSFAADESV
ncbi:uncharacterized protein G2W53_015191 [Senna tora]|uniref:Uncharacterized protein n=1 Tax=Senna tora TaxID=362788 RepID=A0A834WVL4_9FABA|nr:uncharacterized protein G2W53_015191 [Senna tora]